MTTGAGGALRYDYQADLEADTTAAKLVRLVGAGRRVLDLGCAAGALDEVLVARGCTVVGVELDPDAAKLAERYCERVVVGDLDLLDLDEALGDDRFDVVLAADVLEHLRDPAEVLRRVRPFLREGGSLVVSVPNVTHGSVRLALLGGDFPYSETGLLDRTHLHFYTGESAAHMLATGGFAVVHRERQLLGPLDGEVPTSGLEGAPDGVVDFVRADKDAWTYQWVLLAYPHEEVAGLPALVRDLSQRVEGLEDGLEQAVRDGVQAADERTAAALGQVQKALERVRALEGQVEALRREGLVVRDELVRHRELAEASQRRTSETRRELAATDAERQQLLGFAHELQDRLSTVQQQADARVGELQAEIAAMRASRTWVLGSRLARLRRALAGGA